MIFLRQICKERADLLIESDEIRWLKSILPHDYIQQALEREASALNNAISSINSVPQSQAAAQRNSQSNTPHHHHHHHHNHHSHLMSTNKSSSSSSLNQIAAATGVFTADSAECIASLIKDVNMEVSPSSSSSSSSDGYQVVVINISDKDATCPGMLSEDKVLNELATASASARASAAAAAAARSNDDILRASKRRKASGKKSAANRDQRHHHMRHHHHAANGMSGVATSGGARGTCGKRCGGGCQMNERTKYLIAQESDAVAADLAKPPSEPGVDRDEMRSRHYGSVGKQQIEKYYQQ